MKKISLIVCLLAIIPPSYAFSAGAKIAILPWKVNSAENLDYVKDAMPDMLSSRVGAGASVEVLRSDVVKDAAEAERKSGEITEAAAASIGRKLKADYVLYGSLTVFGAAASLDAKFLNVKDGTVTPFFAKGAGIDSVIGMADKLSADLLSALSPAPAQKPVLTPSTEKTLPSPELLKPAQTPMEENSFIIKPKDTGFQKALWMSQRMSGEFIAMAAADIDKDGTKELFLLKNSSVVIARLTNGKLDVVNELANDGPDQNIAITAFDADGDGVPEVYVSALRRGQPSGFAIEFKDNGFKATQAGIKWAMRTAHAGKDIVLIGQKFRKSDGFYGALRLLKKQGAEIVDAGPFEAVSPGLPGRLNLYRFEVIRGAKDNILAALDDREYLRLYKKDADGKWEQFYKSMDFYGGTLDMVNTGDEDLPALGDQEFFTVAGRFFVDDLNNDGKQELVIKRNIPGGLGRYAKVARSFTSGAIVNLSLEGIDDAGSEASILSENWRTKEVSGYIADFFIDDLAGDGRRQMFMLIVEGTGAFAGNIKSYILLNKMAL
ncbi:MAG: VCBS repeat-containing protein [Deltaproteobacteria bacterium]|nr:VCBS repeat-containing protein [Deltaproteobacteria bacterium]